MENIAGSRIILEEELDSTTLGSVIDGILGIKFPTFATTRAFLRFFRLTFLYFYFLDHQVENQDRLRLEMI